MALASLTLRGARGTELRSPASGACAKTIPLRLS